MRWVLITAFGSPVEPEVNRNLATVSPFTLAAAAAAAALGGVSSKAVNGVAPEPGTGCELTSSNLNSPSAASVGAKRASSPTYTRPGSSNLKIPLSLAWSLDISEYACEIGATGTPT